MDKLELTFQVEKDTKNTRRYQEEAHHWHAVHSTVGAA